MFLKRKLFFYFCRLDSNAPWSPFTSPLGGFCVAAFCEWQHLMSETKRFPVFQGCTLCAHQQQAHTCLLVQGPGLFWTFLQIDFLKKTFIILSLTCVHVRHSTCVEVRGHLWESIHHVGSGDQILVVKLKGLYRLSYFASLLGPFISQGLEGIRKGVAYSPTSCKVYPRINHEGKQDYTCRGQG